MKTLKSIKMNKKQIQYMGGRLTNGYYDIIMGAYTGLMIPCVSTTFSRIKGIDDIENIIAAAFASTIALYTGFHALIITARRVYRKIEMREVSQDREKYPLDYADSVIIDDAQGLEKILAMTAEKPKIEFGTLLKVHDDKGRAVIHDFLDIEEGKKIGLIGKATKRSLRMEISKAYREGSYNGCHHYHPRGGGENYAINLNDRCKPKNWLNLLTFNMPEGPEIIGFNLQHIYILKERSNKAELVKATPKQIIQYLKD